MTFDPTQFQPRNSLVLVRLFVKPEETIGVVVVPTANNDYCEAEILAVGPDPVSATGGVPTTHDLKPGQRVYVRHQSRGPQGQLKLQGLKLRHQDMEEGEFHLFEQLQIIAIISDPNSQTGDCVPVKDLAIAL